jgi:hypothetical protein
LVSLAACALVACFAVGACSRRDAGKDDIVRPDPVTSASTAKDAAMPEPPVDFGPSGPVAISPPVPPLESGMMDDAHVLGWAKDGSVFGYCQTDGGMGAEHCGLWPRAGKPELFDDIDTVTSEIDPKKTAAIAARIKKLGLSATSPTWAYAHDIEIVWMVIDGDEMSTPERAAVLKVGGRVRSPGEPAAYVVSMSETTVMAYPHIHPETIAMSPDGRMLGVVSHAFAGEFSDRFSVELVPSAKVATAAYEEAAKAHEKKGDTARAAELFRKAKAVL